MTIAANKTSRLNRPPAAWAQRPIRRMTDEHEPLFDRYGQVVAWLNGDVLHARSGSAVAFLDDEMSLTTTQGRGVSLSRDSRGHKEGVGSGFRCSFWDRDEGRHNKGHESALRR